MSLSIETIASRISWSTSFSGRWSLISWWVRKPRVLPILMSVFSSWRRLATSSSVSWVSSRPNSRISARSLARLTFMRSGLALAATSASATTGSPSRSASRSDRSTSDASGLAALSSPLPFFAATPLAATAPLPLATARRPSPPAPSSSSPRRRQAWLWRPGWRLSTGWASWRSCGSSNGGGLARRRAQLSNCALSCGIQGRVGGARSVSRSATPRSNAGRAGAG